jgi:uncharacterized protein
MANPMCHWELMVGDVATSKAFYSKVFDWTFDDGSFPGYTIIRTGTDPEGGMMAKPKEAPMATLNNYFLVEEIDATLRKAVEAGATVAVPRTPIGEMAWFAMFIDPDGIAIGIYQPRK